MAKELKVGDKCIYDLSKDIGGSDCNHGRQCEIVDVRGDTWTYKYLIRWEGGGEEPVKKESLTKIKKPKTTETMEAQQPTTTTISVSDLKKIHDVACSTWKLKIEKMVKPFEDTVTLTEQKIGEMFDAANDSQAKVLEQVFGERFSNSVFDFGYEHTINTRVQEGPMHIREAFATEGNSHKEIGFSAGFTPVIVINGEEIQLETGRNGAYIKFKKN
jgi:hypothetical protein